MAKRYTHALRTLGIICTAGVGGIACLLLAGCATMPRPGDDVLVPCVKRPADYRWWDWPLAIVGYPVITAIWVAMGSDERAMCPPRDGSEAGNA